MDKVLWCGAEAALVSALLLTWTAQEPPRPQFRAGVTVTRLEVTVLDSRTRKPVTGLTANDFVIRVDGERQPVVSAAEVNVSSAEPTTASVVTEAAHDVSTNDVRATRLFVLIMHDGRGVAFHRNTAKGIAHRFIDQLGPDDLAAVLFVCDNGAAQDFTRDRLLLRQAIDQYEPSGCPLSALSVVRRTQQFLQAVPGYRRAILFVAQLLDEQDAYWDWDLQQIAFMSGFTHVPVYAFSARGLQAPMPDDLVRLHDRYRYDNHVELLRTLAGLTAGRATVLTNAPADAVPAIFEELDSYYAVAYEHQYPEDGRLRRIEVEVTRPDARVVLSRKLVRAPTGDGDARLPDEGRASGLIEAMGEPLPSGDVPLRLAILPVALPDAREQALALALMLPPASAAENYRVQLLVFDGEGRRRLLNQSLEISAPASRDGASGAGPEVALRLDLRPGRYSVRLVAERQRDGQAGSIHATVVVPDFGHDALSMSGVAIGLAGGHPIANAAALDGLLPISPTSRRDFSVDGRVVAFLRLHQAPRRPLQPVVLEAEVIDTAGSLRWSVRRAVAAREFEAGGATDQRFDLPLTDLGVGSYVLRFVAAAGEARAQRDVRFSVQ